MRRTSQKTSRRGAACLLVLVLSGLLAGAAVPATPAQAEVRLPPGVQAIPDIEYEHVDGQTMLGDIYLPSGSGPHPAIVYMHGGGYTAGTRQWMRQTAIFYAQNGYVGFSIDYRLAPEFHYPAPVDDGKAAVEFLRKHASQYNVDPARIGMLGTSAGVTMVADIGAAGRGTTGWKVAGVAGWSGVWFIYDAYKQDPGPHPKISLYVFGDQNATLDGATDGTANADLIKAADPALKVTPASTPYFISNSTNELVPIEEPTEFIDKYLKPNGVPYVFKEIPGNKHAVRTSSVVEQPTLDFFNENVKNWDGKVSASTPTPTPTPTTESPAPTAQPTQAVGPTRSHTSSTNTGLIVAVVIAGLLLIAGMLAAPLIRSSRRDRWGY